MPFPTAHLLVGVGLGEVASAASGISRKRAWLVGGALAAAADLDVLLGIRHGALTHSILAAVAVALLVALIAGRRWAALSFVATASHTLLDLLDGRGRTNVYASWPFSRAKSVAITDVFPEESLSAGGIAAHTLIGIAALGALWALGHRARSRRSGRARR